MIDRIARQISFFAPAAVMSAWAVVMLHTIAAGHINRFLSPLFRNYVLIAGVFLLVLSALYLYLYQPAAETAPAFARRGRLRQLGRWTALLVPVIAACILAPDAFTMDTIDKRMTGPAPGTPGMPLPTTHQDDALKLDSDPNQPANLEVTDLIMIGRSADQIKAFDGRKVRVVGRIINPTGSSPKLVRMIMWCCAADAQPVSVDLSGNTAGDWKDGQWLEVIGAAQFPSTLGNVIPNINVESIKPTDEPDEPYLSP